MRVNLVGINNVGFGNHGSAAGMVVTAKNISWQQKRDSFCNAWFLLKKLLVLAVIGLNLHDQLPLCLV